MYDREPRRAGRGGRRRSSPAASTTSRKLARFARGVDVVTFDWENVPVASVRAIAQHRARVAAAARARGRAGPLAGKADVPPPRHSGRAVRAPVDTRARSRRARSRRSALPGILKTRRLGYDGKGQVPHPPRRATRTQAWQRTRRTAADLRTVRARSRARSRSIARARPRRAGRDLSARRESRTPHGILADDARALPDAALQRAAERNHRRLMQALGYVGVLCVEYFVDARPAGRQRDGAARAQLRPLDHRGRRDQPVREPRPRGRGPAARHRRARAATP